MSHLRLCCKKYNLMDGDRQVRTSHDETYLIIPGHPCESNLHWESSVEKLRETDYELSLHCCIFYPRS
jgi:hypothetical protein